MRNMSLLLFSGCVLFAGRCFGDWPMPGHDVGRTSCSTEAIGVCADPVWCVPFDPYIPSRACVVTKEAGGGVAATVYVTAADGIYALEPDTGTQRWVYSMDLPPGDVPTISGTTLYVGGLDKRIHAVDCSDGSQIWQSDRGGAGFYVNPLVVDGKVYAGCLDGYFYCFDSADGSLEWYYEVGERVSFSAAYGTSAEFPDGLVYFAGEDCKAYALRADTGALVWERTLFADTFTAYWPVVSQGRVMFVNCNNYPTGALDLRGIQHEVLTTDISAYSDGQGNYDLQHHIDWLSQYPERNTFFILDALDGSMREQSPFLFWGNPGGQRYPAAVASDGMIWLDTPWENEGWFGKGRYGGWMPGNSLVRYTSAWESSDEPEAHSIIGDYLYRNDGGDGVDKGGVYSLSSGQQVGDWTNATFRGEFGSYWGNWADRKYGNPFRDGLGNTWQYRLGHHGHQNPPTPLNGKVYFHRSNAVICMEP